MSGVFRLQTESLAWFSFPSPSECVRGSGHASEAVMPRAFPRSAEYTFGSMRLP